jgi:protein-L-isoaspartate(D-aspartate) O-methyltransferase
MDHARPRQNMVENQLRPNRVDDPRVLAAMGEVPRERFVPKALRGVAYADEDLLLPGGGFLIEPLVLGRLVQTARAGPDDVALVLGCTTGYAGAVLSRLAGTVIICQPDAASVSQIETLLDDLGAANVVVVECGDPLDGHPSQAPYDVIVVAGSVEEVPEALLQQLGEGGRLVAVVDAGGVGKGTLFSRLHGAIGRRELFDAQIPPVPGVRRPAEFAF